MAPADSLPSRPRGIAEEGARRDDRKRNTVPASAGRGTRKLLFSPRPGCRTGPRAPELTRTAGPEALGREPARHWVCSVLEPVPPGSPGRGSQLTRQRCSPSRPVAAARNPPLLLSYLAMHYPQCICKMTCRKKVSCSHHSYKDCLKNSDFVIVTFYSIGKKFTYFSWLWHKT